MGPLLFLLFNNDIENGLENPIRRFASDGAIYRAVRFEEDALPLQADLVKLQRWANKWEKRFNAEKYKVLRLTRRT